MIMTWLHLQAK